MADHYGKVSEWLRGGRILQGSQCSGVDSDTPVDLCSVSEKKQSLDQALRSRSKLYTEVSQEGVTPVGYVPGGGATVCLSGSAGGINTLG